MGALLERCRTALRWRTTGDRGFILIVVISAIGILALVAASFAQITSSHVRAAASAVQSAGAEALADAGVQLAILDLVAARSGNAPPRQRFTTDGVAQTCDAGDGNWLAIAVQDEAGKVDVNVADERLIRALLRGTGVRQALRLPTRCSISGMPTTIDGRKGRSGPKILRRAARTAPKCATQRC